MRSRTIVIAAFVLAIVFAVSSVAMARGFGKSDKSYRSGQGLMGLRTVMELNLSDSQRDQALKIMETYQIDRVKARGDLIRDRDNLRKALQADKVNEQGVRKAYKKLSSVREDRLIARANMMTEIKAILTPEQVKLLDERAAEQSDRTKSQRGCGRYSAGGCSGDCTRK